MTMPTLCACFGSASTTAGARPGGASPFPTLSNVRLSCIPFRPLARVDVKASPAARAYPGERAGELNLRAPDGTPGRQKHGTTKRHELTRKEFSALSCLFVVDGFVRCSKFRARPSD